LDFVVRTRIRTVAQFEIANYRRFPATVAPRRTTEKPIVGAQVLKYTLAYFCFFFISIHSGVSSKSRTFLFALGAILQGLSGNIQVFLVARAIMGIGWN